MVEGGAKSDRRNSSKWGHLRLAHSAREVALRGWCDEEGAQVLEGGRGEGGVEGLFAGEVGVVSGEVAGEGGDAGSSSKVRGSRAV